MLPGHDFVRVQSFFWQSCAERGEEGRMFSFVAELFGKSREVRELDRNLHQMGLNSHAVNDATKFTICKWIRELLPDQENGEAKDGRRAELQRAAAELLTYCVLGRSDFTEANSVDLAEAQEARIAAATEGENDFDAGIIMLTLHANIADPDIAARVEIESE